MLWKWIKRIFSILFTLVLVANAILFVYVSCASVSEKGWKRDDLPTDTYVRAIVYLKEDWDFVNNGKWVQIVDSKTGKIIAEQTYYKKIVMIEGEERVSYEHKTNVDCIDTNKLEVSKTYDINTLYSYLEQGVRYNCIDIYVGEYRYGNSNTNRSYIEVGLFAGFIVYESLGIVDYDMILSYDFNGGVCYPSEEFVPFW